MSTSPTASCALIMRSGSSGCLPFLVLRYRIRRKPAVAPSEAEPP